MLSRTAEFQPLFSHHHTWDFRVKVPLIASTVPFGGVVRNCLVRLGNGEFNPLYSDNSATGLINRLSDLPSVRDS